MQISCKRCGAAIKLPSETQTGDVIRCGDCGKKIRIKVRPSRRRVRPANEAVPAEPEPRGGSWTLRLAALAVLGGVGFLIFRNGPPDVDDIKGQVQRTLAATGLVPAAALGGKGETDPLAAQVATLFEARCHRCHGAGGSDEGGFNFVLRLDKLTEDDAYVTAGSPDDSYLFSRIADGEMPPPDADEALSEDEIALVRAWIDAGAPGLSSDRQPIELVDNDDLLRTMRQDLEGLDDSLRRGTRYFTLTHLYNAGLSQDELETYRLAMAKLLNSLSWEPTLVTPVRVGDEETLLRINLSDVGWDAETWEAVVDTDPYAVTVSSEDGRAIQQMTETDVPHVRADWFVSRASRAPLYYDILEIPDTLDELAQRPEIAVDIDQNIAADEIVRAAFIESGVSDHNRMIERHEISTGGFWVSYDFASSVGQQNVLQHPLGPDGADAFDHDGGEIIFNLPNGLQGYMLVDGEGKRIEKGPIEIVADDKQADRAVVAGLSCMSCHANGMIRKQDEVRPTVLANRDAFPNADRILRQYPEADVLDEVLTEDTDRFESALQQLGFDRLTDTSEPIFHMSKRFDQAVDGSLAAAEFGLAEDRFFELLDNSPEIAKVLGVLKTPNGKVKRQQFLAAFKDASEAFGLGIGLRNEASPAATQLAQAATSSNTAPATPPTAAPNVTPGANTAPATVQQSTVPAQSPASLTASTSPAAAPQQVAGASQSPAGVPTEGQPVSQPVKVLAPEDFLHDWTKANGDPLVSARFLAVTPAGDVRVALVPRQWRLAGDDADYEYQAFSGTFWAFYQKPGTPIMVRIGEISLPDVPLNYVDYPRDAFSDEDQTYLSHLEQLAAYTYVSKGRVRYYTFPWDILSVDDQQYVYDLIATLQAAQAATTPLPSAGELPGDQSPPPGSPSTGSPPQGATPELPPGQRPSGPPPSVSAPEEAPAGPPDLPSPESVASPVPPDQNQPAPRQPYGY